MAPITFVAEAALEDVCAGEVDVDEADEDPEDATVKLAAEPERLWTESPVALVQLTLDGTVALLLKVRSAHCNSAPSVTVRRAERIGHTWNNSPSPPSKTNWTVTLAPSWTPEMPEARRSTGKQKAPSPVTWKKGTACVKLAKFVGLLAVDKITPTDFLLLVNIHNGA